MQEFDILDAMADVAGVAMKPNQGGSSFAMRDEPTIETDVISGREKHVFKLESNFSGRMLDGRAGIKDEIGFHPTRG